MSPTIETSTPYKTAPHALISATQHHRRSARAASPPESVSSDQSNSASISSSSGGGTSSNNSNGFVSDGEYYNVTTKSVALAGSDAHQKSCREQEGGTGKTNDAKERPPTYRFDLTLPDLAGGPVAVRGTNNNASQGANAFQQSIRQEPRYSTTPGHSSSRRGVDAVIINPTPPLFNNISDKTTDSPGSSNSTTGETQEFQPISFSSPALTLGSVTQIGNRSVDEKSTRGGLLSQRDHVRKSYLPSDAPRRRTGKMAAEGDNQDEPLVQPETRTKPRKKVTSDPNHVSHQFFHLEPCLYSHRMFVRAAQIFSVLKQDDADTEENKALRRRQGRSYVNDKKIPEMDFMNAQEQIKTFELTFATLKFQKLFSSILDYIGFFHEFTGLRQVHSLCYVILYDLQIRKFQRRVPFPDEVLDPDCSEVEDALMSQKTKLQANIAKERVKNHAPSIEYLLPEHIRNKDETKTKTPVYLWVNQLKTTIPDVIENLKSSGFEELFREDMSEQIGSVFSVDPHCSDLLTFPPDMDMEIKTWDFVTSGLLVQQDKSSCLAPQSVPFLLGADHDVIHVNVGNAATTCHMASLLRHKCPNVHIFAFGIDGTERARKVTRNFELLGVKNIRIMHDEFLSVDPEDPRFKSVRVILISANCSKSAITSPVQFIVSEGEDTQILGKLSVAETDMTMVGELMAEHERILKHAFRFPKLQAVVYTTRSRYEAENEVVVTKVLEFFNMTSGRRPLFKVVPPVIPFFGDEINSDVKNGVDGRFIRFRPSDRANGCFVAVMAKEPEDPKEGRFAHGKSKAKSLSKTKSAPSGLAEGEPSAAADLKPGKANGKGSRKTLKSGASASELKCGSPTGLRAKLSLHKSPTAVGARLYQAGLMKKMESGGLPSSPSKPEHLKVIKHPAPFRDSDVEDSNEE